MQQMSTVRDRPRSNDQTRSAFSTLATSMASVFDDFVQEVAPPRARRFDRRPIRRGRQSRCECERQPCPCTGSCGCRQRAECQCGTQESRCDCSRSEVSCECTCCIGDVDLVVYTRVGETRVVPIEIHNPRRRERELEIELSPFTTNSGKPTGIEGVLTGGGTVKLGPCETLNITMMTRALSTETHDNNNRLPDVDTCVVAYAELRILGCDMRSQRIAVAVLPLSCGGHEIECQPGCC